jgi:hypothetical protein
MLYNLLLDMTKSTKIWESRKQIFLDLPQMDIKEIKNSDIWAVEANEEEWEGYLPNILKEWAVEEPRGGQTLLNIFILYKCMYLHFSIFTI